ncbi:MAG: rod shape-determining protein MreD [Elusimicrobia bacterium]|nr:rod shape-determining protein MreD [Elusimicrobiota bacterium]
MKRIGFFGVTLFATLSLQIVIHRVVGGWVGPHLMLLVVLAVGWRHGPLTGELMGFVGGLLADAGSLAPFGLQTTLLTVAGYGAGRGRGRLDEGNLIAQLALAVIASVGYLLGTILLTQLFRGGTVWRWGIGAWCQPLWDGVVAPVIFRGMWVWEGWWRVRRVAGYE